MSSLVNGSSLKPSTPSTDTPAGSASQGTSLHVTEWQDQQVSNWLASLNLGNLAASFKEQGITGDVLVQLDNEAFKELGVDSVGQRLALLGGIYRLKETWGLDIDAGDYRPQSEDIRAVEDPPVTVPQLIACLRQRDERIVRLEQELRRTTVFLAKFQYDFTGICRYQGLRAPTTDYAFQPFVPANANSLGRKTSTQAGLLSPALYPNPTATGTPTQSHHPNLSHGQHQAASHQHQGSSSFGSSSQTQSQGQSSIGSPGLTTSAKSSGAAASHGTDGGFSGPQSAWSAASSYQNTLARAAMGAANSTSDGNSSRNQSQAQQTSTANSEDATEDSRIRTPSSAPPTDPVSPGLMGAFNAAAAAHANESTNTHSHTHTSDGPLASPGGLSSSGSISTPTSATHPPWARGQGATTAMNGRSIGKGSGGHGAPISPPPTGALPAAPGTSSRTTGLASPGSSIQQAATSSLRAQQQQASSLSSKSRTEGSSGAGRDFVGTATTLGTGDNSYKSFRVTLEDPCYKVLPAALKKYKINDDWRLYALFICYGSTERCLSYDEKPLLLFQKLKEARQNPVFMLRHIRDVKSPLSIAHAKAAARRGSANSSGSRREGKDGSGGAAAKNSKVLRLTPGSGFAAALGTEGKNASEVLLTGPVAQLPNPEASRSYAIAIYPYVCEREDEFDVSVGDTFVVLSKAKGWWVVQCDSHASGVGDMSGSAGSDGADGSPDRPVEIRSGWVPAGCLIETSRPLSSVAGPDGTTSALARTNDADGGDQADHSSIPIPPSIITSTSTPGIMLMDYTSDALTSTASTEEAQTQPSTPRLELKKEDRLKVFKRYNHWSYCVQENGKHARGWVPSWYIGKVSTRSASAGAAAASAAGESAGASAGGVGGIGGGVSDPSPMSSSSGPQSGSGTTSSVTGASTSTAPSSLAGSPATTVPADALLNSSSLRMGSGGTNHGGAGKGLRGSGSNESLKDAMMISNIAGIE